MVSLDDPMELQKLDTKNVLGSTDLFLAQCEQIYKLINNSSVFEKFTKPIYNIVFCGMGGSALGAQVVYHLFKQELVEPLYINNDYDLPKFAGQNTLVILSSYSGTTEEVISCYEEAKKRGCMVLGFTTGGKLASQAESNNDPVIIVDPINNPSGQPRLGTGYNVVGTMMILKKLGLLDLDENALTKDIQTLKEKQETVKNIAKEIAGKIYGQIPLIITASHLVGCAYVLRNQFNETAKSFAAYSPLPELNHHLMEGLKNPPRKNMVALVIESNLYHETIQKRTVLTENVIEKNDLSVVKYKPVGPTKLIQALETLIFGGYLTFYLAMLYEQDPSLIPWVDYFKEQLAK